MRTLLLLCLAITLSSCEAISSHIHLLRPQSGSSGRHLEGINCLSWRFAVETNNFRNWRVVPQSCKSYVGHYMLGKQYRMDCEEVANIAIEYAKSLQLAGDGMDAWIFDIDETALAIPYNSTKFNEWVEEGTAPAIPSMLELYKVVQSLGIKTVFLTGSAGRLTEVRAANLRGAGFDNWERLILRGEADTGTTSVEYKSNKRRELVVQGYRIVGNIGDQWGDLLGDNAGNRTFKVPDPMYYIA